MKLEFSKEWWMRKIAMEGDYEIGAGIPGPLPEPIQNETARRLATVRRIDDLQPIPGADKIECARVDGWYCVVSRGEFQVGDPCIYFEIDSFIPVGEGYPHFEFLRKRAIKWNGKEGCRLRTIRLKGQVSQGLAMPLSAFPQLSPFADQIDRDLTTLLDVEKWEAPIPAQLSGKVKGNFPAGIPKTDQPRLQNMGRELADLRRRLPDVKVEVTTKIDGSSMTAYMLRDGTFGVCSRNLDLVRDEANAFWAYAIRTGLEQKLNTYREECGMMFSGIAVQGELFGPGIQGNKERLTQTEFAVFDIFWIADGGPAGIEGYMRATDRRRVCEKYGLSQVPLLGYICLSELATIEDFKSWSVGDSWTPGVKREGAVFKVLDEPHMHWKCINEEWLLENE